MIKTMNVAQTKEVASSTLGNLFDTYKTSHLSSNSVYEAYRTVATDFLKGLPQNTKQEILSTNFSIEENLPDFNTIEEKYDFILGFDNFVITVKNVVEQYEPKFLNFEGLKRQSAPPLAVFKYIGHNELDIIQNNSDYSLLFD